MLIYHTHTHAHACMLQLLLTVVFVVTITEPDSNTPDILHYIFLIFPTYG